MTALACGMIAVGSCNGDVTSTILQTIMEKSETELKDTYARWLPLGLGLNHLGKHIIGTTGEIEKHDPGVKYLGNRLSVLLAHTPAW